MQHIGETLLRHLYGKSLNLAGPKWDDTGSDSGKWESPDSVKQAAHGLGAHFVTAAAIALVVCTAA